MLNNALVMQLSTTEGNSYYVGTKMDAFVYDTLNAWYQEDMNTVSPSLAPCRQDTCLRLSLSLLMTHFQSSRQARAACATDWHFAVELSDCAVTCAAGHPWH